MGAVATAAGGLKDAPGAEAAPPIEHPPNPPAAVAAEVKTAGWAQFGRAPYAKPGVLDTLKAAVKGPDKPTANEMEIEKQQETESGADTEPRVSAVAAAPEPIVEANVRIDDRAVAAAAWDAIEPGQYPPRHMRHLSDPIPRRAIGAWGSIGREAEDPNADLAAPDRELPPRPQHYIEHENRMAAIRAAEQQRKTERNRRKRENAKANKERKVREAAEPKPAPKPRAPTNWDDIHPDDDDPSNYPMGDPDLGNPDDDDDVFA
jgi:hypothetical protein